MAVKRYNGTSWDVVAGKGDQGTSSSITTWVKTASGGETSLTGSSDSSTTLAYTPGQEQFFINGVLQVRGSDYTATNGTSITGITALVAGDIATVTSVNAFSVTGAVPLSTVTANGDLIVGTSSGAVGRLGIGSTGNVLTVSGGVPAWSAPAGGGKVLQVVYGSTTSGVANSTSTYADTNLTATITPSSTSSKVLVLVSQNGLHKSAANTLNRIGLKVFRSATEIAFAVFNYLPTATLLTTGSASYSILDTPATTSATTYKTQFANLANAAAVVVQDNSDLSTMILMEIGA
jgi:hypothetical protein